MKNLFLLFTAVLLLTMIKNKHKSDERKQIVRIDVLRFHKVNRDFTLFVPRTIKFGSKLVDENKEGFIFVNVANKEYCYKRPIGITRNEYFLEDKCSESSRLVDVTYGDVVTINFSKSNMFSADNVVFFGQEGV